MTPGAKRRNNQRPPPGLKLHIAARAGAAYVPYLRQRLLRAHAIVRPALCELSLALVGDAAMSRLHRRFLNLDGPTDVLTFELEHDAAGRVTSGEVIICVAQAARQSRLRGVRPQDELLLYALHGMLHLCGYDDRTDRDFAKMHAREDQILRQVGVGEVFARERSGSASAAARKRPRPPPRKGGGR